MEILSFLKRTQALCYIERCSNVSHIRPYSVAQHSFYITLYAMVFADLENERIEKTFRPNLYDHVKKAMLYDISLVVQKALIHDLEETIIGDILYPVHHSNQSFKQELEEVKEKSIDQEVFRELPKKVRDYYIRLWKTSKDNTKEGKLVACMDKFEILMFSLQELDMGNKGFKILYDNALEIMEREFDIPSVNGVIKDIRRWYG